MIELLRIDERLIHGQVATTWTKQLGINAIVVANDEAAANPLVTMTLKMAAPPGVKAAIRSVREAVELLNDVRSRPMKILIVVDHPRDALTLVKQVAGIPLVNVGNFGRSGKDQQHRRQLSSCFFANEEELSQLREIREAGIPCEVRALPSDPVKELKKLI